MARNQQKVEGLEWVRVENRLVPRWTAEPDVEGIKEAIKSRLPPWWTREITVTYLAEGALNKIYVVRFAGLKGELLMRVSLPVEPELKTLSEVAVLEWVRRNTSLPVPRILTYQVCVDNPIGFEWMFMSKIPGGRLEDGWSLMDFSAKKRIVEHLVMFSSSLFRKQLRGIGNIYPSSLESKVPALKSIVQNEDNDDIPVVRRMVSMEFFWGDHARHSIYRGPFQSSKAWLEARLSLIERDCLYTIGRRAREGNYRRTVKDTNGTLAIIDRLNFLITNDFFFTSSEKDEAEHSMLCHHDLSGRNILVDEAGALTGVIDWECVSALPLWKACNYPLFLLQEPLDKEPVRANYGDGKFSKQLYLKDMVRHELTLLRRHFLDEMQRLEPGWVKVFEASEQRRDLDLAVQYCSVGRFHKRIDLWIDGVLGATKPCSLDQMLYNLSLAESQQ